MKTYKIKLSESCDYGQDAENLDLSDISGTNCYCDDVAMAEIVKRTENIPVNAIHFIDSGNYHYMTLVWLRRISKPFSLVVFDNHTDCQDSAFGNITSCGGWIREALDTLPMLQKVYLIGADPELVAKDNPGEKVVYIDTRQETSGDLKKKPGKERTDQTGSSLGKTNDDEKNIPVYVSIDKDVISSDYFKANWSQGNMTPDLLEEYLKTIISNNQLLGIDICGGCGDMDDTAANDMNRRFDERLMHFLENVLH